MKSIIGVDPVIWTNDDGSSEVLLEQLLEIKGFELRAYNELESFFEDPEPYLELTLTSAGVIAFINDFNHILLVETTDDSSGEKRVELPSGKVNRDIDEDIFETAIREFIEETGLLIQKEDLLPFMPKCQKDHIGGLQFTTRVGGIKFERKDDLGRYYLRPVEGTDKGRTLMLISEPLEVFSNPSISLLKHSRHLWAVDYPVRLALLLLAQQKKIEESQRNKKRGLFRRR